MKNQIKVRPEWRINTLHENGSGSKVCVEYRSRKMVYDNVQYPQRYIAKIMESEEYKKGIITNVYEIKE